MKKKKNGEEEERSEKQEGEEVNKDVLLEREPCVYALSMAFHEAKKYEEIE